MVAERKQLVVVTALCLLLIPCQWVSGAKILMHGRIETPTFRDDGLVYEHLQELFGAGNVDYMMGLSAAADGSSANGYDAIVISSSLGSNDIRGKYEDTPVGVLFWENALLKLQVGDFQMSDGSGNWNPGAVDRTMLTIVDPTHPLAAGLSGDVAVFNAPTATQYAKGVLGPGVKLIGKMTAEPTEYGIIAADVGDPLLGDGSAGRPATADGRRVMFFLSDSDNGFAQVSDDGIKLFDAAAHWVTERSNPCDLNSDGAVDAADAGIMFGDWGGPGSTSPADKNKDGFVDAADAGVMFAAWTGDPVTAGTNAATAEYNAGTGELKISSAGAVNVFVQSASGKITPLNPAPAVPVGLLTNNASRVGITNLGPINTTNFSFGSIGAGLAKSDLKLVYTPALGQKGIEIVAGAAGFSYIPEPASLGMLGLGLAGLLAGRRRS